MENTITLSKEEIESVFSLWNSGLRANPENFYTSEECATMEVATLSQKQAITFVAYLRELRSEV